jgi:hypothetical protein
MNGKTSKVARTGSVMVRINNKFYEVPESVFLFKSHDDKDIYLSGIKNDSTDRFKANWLGTVRFIEENRFEDVPLEALDKFMYNQHKKFVIDNEEYDIPLYLSSECREKILTISIHFPKRLEKIKELYKDYLFKSN